ncbi:hypothetical protein PENTCL1PPCAC_22705 [Pristionchus entomophagus]|uniref:Palmitoyltransferase n=1 Tax=Pristionchus entomophagus TaxID=358040 RepID=A0AAV5U1Z9_9BILA|nr:hypothetical protein PENTCL1PPCAC_22705 [Pristionchus entomophagus]
MQLRKDPCGIFCVILIYASLVYADYALSRWMILPTFSDGLWAPVHIIIFNIILFLVVVSHSRTMLADPGIVPLNKSSEEKLRRSVPEYSDDESGSDNEIFLRPEEYVGEDWSVCTRCESFRPPRAHHCRVCRRCIRRMDHHCPWVNNCVGELNQKYFLQFLIYVGLCSGYAIFVIIHSWINHSDHGETGLKGPRGQSGHHIKVVHTIVLSMEALLFGMFVLAVSCDQLSAIFNDETAIESVQRRNRRSPRRSKRVSKISLLRGICGNGSIWTWLLPCTPSTFEREVIHFPSAPPHYDV